jgi:hypothetical protein
VPVKGDFIVSDFVTKDSGERQTFSTGARRDTQTDKDRYDLIPTHALRRVAGLYARGAEKYDDNNWQKGIPFSRCMASLERHLHQFKQGDIDEDHLAAVVWNALAIMHYQEVGREDLDDLHRGKWCPYAPKEVIDGYSHNYVEPVGELFENIKHWTDQK